MNGLEYYPNSKNKYFIMYLMICELFFLTFLIILCSSTKKNNIIFMLVIIIMIAIYIYYNYRQFNLKIVFRPETVQVINVSNKVLCEKGYSEVPYAYYGRGIKKHLYLVLSPCLLDDVELQKILRCGGDFERNVYKGCIIMRINEKGMNPRLFLKSKVQCVKSE